MAEMSSATLAAFAAEDEALEDTGYLKGVHHLREKMSTRNSGSKAALTELEESRARVRDAYQVQMVLLKELELERIDLQMAVQRVASMRQNWKSQYVGHRLTASPDVEQKLAELERAAVSDVQSTDANISKAVAQVARLRDLQDVIDRRLYEKRQHCHVEGQMIGQLEDLLSRRPNSTRSTPRRNQPMSRDLYSMGGGKTHLPDPVPLSGR